MNLEKHLISLELYNSESAKELPNAIMLLPPSPVLGRDGRKFNYNQEQILKSFAENNKKMPVDIDHHSEYGFNTAAVGWVNELFVEDDAIWGKVEWNSKGKELLAEQIYKYISPAGYVDEDKNMISLSSAALTNHPNLKMPALNSKQNNNGEAMEKSLNLSLINKALDIKEDAEFDITLNKILDLKEKVKEKIDLNNFVPKKDYEAVLNKKEELELQLNEIYQKEVEGLIEESIKDGRIDASSKDYYLDMCKHQEGLARTKEFLAKKPKLTDVVLANKEQKATSVHFLSPEDIKYGKKMGVSEEDLIKSKQELNKRKNQN